MIDVGMDGWASRAIVIEVGLTVVVTVLDSTLTSTHSSFPCTLSSGGQASIARTGEQ
jgi:hypothetical protein